MPSLDSDPNAIPPAENMRRADFMLVPIPRRLRYDPERQPRFGLLLNAIFCGTSTVVVANVCYCQPILIQLASTFDTDYNRISQIPTLALGGYGVGLLLVAPLGDLVPRRPLLLGTISVALVLTVGLCITTSLVAFEVITFIIGIFSIAPQVLIPLAADLAPPERRASAMSLILAGLLFGVLLARALGGLIAEFASWRDIYYMALGAQGAVLVALWATLPDYPAKNPDLTYARILGSMAKLVVTEPTLVQACIISMASSACFSGYWVSLTFLLGSSPYNYSTLGIGLWGLLGIAAVMLAPLLGKLIDRLVPWYGALIATGLLILNAAIYWGAAGVNIAAVVVTTIGVDVFRQMQQVSLATSVVSINSAMRTRLNSVYIIAIFVGQVVGSSVCTTVYIKYGWRALGALMFALSAFQIPILLIRGPHTPRHTWFGHEGGYEFRRKAVPARENQNQGGDFELAGKDQASANGANTMSEGVPRERMADEKRDNPTTRV
ncbi:MFS general substrate transporter [Peniophora sp. CONT]|nr:MFS general substrate transporter [Peniophora sp. CONT]